MQLIIIVAAVIMAYALLACVPVRKEVLGEGVFNGLQRNESSGFHLHDYYFDAYCQTCFKEKEKRKYHALRCFVTVPSHAWQLRSFVPQQGDSIKIVGYRNILGGTPIYRIVQTNFAEETGPAQIREEAEERKAYAAALELEAAMYERMTVDQYRKKMKEEAVHQAVEILEITPEEVVAGNYHTMNRGMLLAEKKARQINAETGSSITAQEVFDEEKRAWPRWPTQNSPRSSCVLNEWENIDASWEYAATGIFNNESLRQHVEACDKCRALAEEKRNAYLTPAESDCLTDEELSTLEVTGFAPREQEGHIPSCERCLIRAYLKERAHLKAPPGPECLNEEDAHILRTTGEVPSHKQAHVNNCKRCWNEAYKQRAGFIRQTVALPPFEPQERLVHWKNKKTFTGSLFLLFKQRELQLALILRKAP